MSEEDDPDPVVERATGPVSLELKFECPGCSAEIETGQGWTDDLVAGWQISDEDRYVLCDCGVLVELPDVRLDLVWAE